jgi:hypothetical protein
VRVRNGGDWSIARAKMGEEMGTNFNTSLFVPHRSSRRQQRPNIVIRCLNNDAGYEESKNWL